MPTRNNYDDIINLPHHVSKTRLRMSQQDRAAQFSPFAALTGFDEKIEETAMLVSEGFENASKKPLQQKKNDV